MSNSVGLLRGLPTMRFMAVTPRATRGGSSRFPGYSGASASAFHRFPTLRRTCPIGTLLAQPPHGFRDSVVQESI